ncbi:ATP-binding cassette domain-containing protein [Nocardia asteroides]|uniref:ATP-binding cassette domain-containing protein n=1 Tax=Nocardia asteroides TaxID=1824 RepID=UPI001E372E4C|nr:ATP-binding cassette domain-containing protein [Nocardia asteroides]UGT57374.1 ATP-binding cassette domain-containing protein [Nocardia asteroides]
MSLTIDSLTVRIPLRGKDVVHAATEVSLDVPAGSITALVGESGCGKSIVASAVLGVLPPEALVSGSVRLHVEGLSLDVLDGMRAASTRRRLLGRRGIGRIGQRREDTGATRDAVRAPAPRDAGFPDSAGRAGPRNNPAGHPTGTARAQGFRGRHIALIPQSPGTHFTPVRTIGSQLVETIAALGTEHSPEELVARAGLPASALSLYPHELSGGMAQRAAVAAALAGDPEVIVADEPTSGLDRARTDQIGELLRDCADGGAAVLLITHDLSHLLRAGIADTLAIMYASRLMEVGPADQVLADPWHDYTGDLLAALPERGLTPLPHPPRALTNLCADCPYAGGPTALLREDQRLIRRARS